MDRVCGHLRARQNLNSILRLQKRAGRVILNAPFNSQDSWTCLIHLQRLPLTRPLEGFFSLCWNLSFRGRHSTVSMGFSPALMPPDSPRWHTSTRSKSNAPRPQIVNLLCTSVSDNQSSPPPPRDLPLRPHLVRLLFESHLPIKKKNLATGLNRIQS